MSIDVSYLQELGYSEEELRSYAQSWADGILEYLSNNQTNVIENMRFIQTHFDSDLLLKLPVFYPDAFILDPQSFNNHVSLLKTVFPDNWSDIIEKQFWGYDGTDGTYMTHEIVKNPILYQPYLETIGTNREKDILTALQSLQKPWTRIYKFIVMLEKDAGIDISAEDISEDYLLDLEAGKYEVMDNVAFLQQQGLANIIIENILICSPLLFCETETELENSLITAFGDNYPKKMEAPSIEQLEEALFQL